MATELFETHAIRTVSSSRAVTKLYTAGDMGFGPCWLTFLLSGKPADRYPNLQVCAEPVGLFKVIALNKS